MLRFTHVFPLIAILCFGPVLGCGDDAPADEVPELAEAHVSSPDGALDVTLQLRSGVPSYTVRRGDVTVVSDAPLGIHLRGQRPLNADLVVVEIERDTVDRVWQPVWGEQAEIREHYNEMVVQLRHASGSERLRVNIGVRVFDDGLGIRYIIPEQAGLTDVEVIDEDTGFRFAQDGTAWWTPADFEGDEALYNQGGLNDIVDANTPLTVKLADDLYVAVHEADLEDYAAMTLAAEDGVDWALRAALVPAKSGAGNEEVKAARTVPFETPWRTLTIGADAGDLIESRLILNLNDPCAICDSDTSWIQPSKYVGVWWEIHKGTSTWEPGPNVAATTENIKRYIDFAGEHEIPYVLAEGWNVGWDGSWTDMDFTQAHDQCDLPEVVSYAASKGVTFMAHMETGANVAGFAAQMDEAFALYESLGITAIKTGYVGSIPSYYHYSQHMVNHYREVVEKAAAHKIMVNAHEPIKPTGARRTYPNFMSREGVRGMEWNAWSAGNPPSHTLIVPFTRMLGGPVDYNPGIFDVLWLPDKVSDNPFFGSPPTRVHSTRARQLALYVILFSGVQMVTDVPENYQGQPEFQFIKDVPVSWDELRVVHGEIGEYITIARRQGDSWYLGSGTNESARSLDIALDFLGSGDYVAETYTDAAAADFAVAPNAVEMRSFLVTAGDTLVATMEAGGGQAVRLRPATAEDKASLDPYARPSLAVQSIDVPAEVIEDDFVVMTARINNAGSLVGGQSIALSVNGEDVQTRLVRVDGGDAIDAEFEIQISADATEIAIGDAAPASVVVIDREAAPAAPTNLRITEVEANALSLQWDPVPDVIGYRVYRHRPGGIYGHTAHTAIAADVTALRDDDDVSLGETYSYIVRAVHADDVLSPASNQVSATATAPPVPVTFRVRVPESTPPGDTIYMPGSIDLLGPWDPGLLKLSDQGGGIWQVTVDIPAGTAVQYKFTRGSWERVEWWGDITGVQNRSLVVPEDMPSLLVEHTSTDWANTSISDTDKGVRYWRDPLVVATTPADGFSGAAPATVEIVFARDIEATASGYNAAVQVTRGAAPVAGSVTESAPGTLVFTPDAALPAGTYQVQVSEVQSPLGEDSAAMQAPYGFAFTVTSMAVP